VRFAAPLLVGLLVLGACATTGGQKDKPTFAVDLSADPDILLAEARAYLMARHFDDAAVRFEKLLTGMSLGAEDRLFIAGGLFLARSEQGRLGRERQAATSLLNAWAEVPGATDDARFSDIERLVQRATLVLRAAEAELDREYFAGPSNALLVHARSDAEFFLSRSRCGDDLRGSWVVVERVEVNRYREYYDRIVATCDKGGETREFWVDTSIWNALVAVTAEGAEPPEGFTREEAELLVATELRAASMGFGEQ